MDFLYKIGIKPRTVEKELQLVKLKSKMKIDKTTFDQIVHIKKKNHFDHILHLANVNRTYQETWKAGNDLTAKQLKVEIIQNPTEFSLIELSDKNQGKIDNKVSKYKNVTDKHFKFMEIIRNDEENCHTGKFLDLF